MKIVCGIILLMTSLAMADNPDTDRSDKHFDTPQPHTIGGALVKTKDGVNRGLNKMDNGLHKGARKTKQHANSALNKVDTSIHDHN